jgi:hypothetical protein
MATKQQRSNQQEGWSTVGKRARASGEGRTPAYTVSPPHHTLTVKQIRAITVVAGAGWAPVALRTEQINDPDIGSILQEVEAGQWLI